jgi:hypothetical protein
MSLIMSNVIMLSVVKLSAVSYAERNYTDCNAECHYTELRGGVFIGSTIKLGFKSTLQFIGYTFLI